MSWDPTASVWSVRPPLCTPSFCLYIAVVWVKGRKKRGWGVQVRRNTTAVWGFLVNLQNRREQQRPEQQGLSSDFCWHRQSFGDLGFVQLPAETVGLMLNHASAPPPPPPREFFIHSKQKGKHLPPEMQLGSLPPPPAPIYRKHRVSPNKPLGFPSIAFDF